MIAFRGKLCNQAATQVRISLEGNTGKRVSIQAGSIHPALHPRNPREKKTKRKEKKASITCRGTDERTGALRAGSDGDDSGVLPGAQGATRQESDGCGHPERWMLLDDDE